MAEAYFRVGSEKQERKERILQKWRKRVGMGHEFRLALYKALEYLLAFLTIGAVPLFVIFILMMFLLAGSGA